jgi:hypothetical protein
LNQTLTVRRSKNLILPLLKYSKCWGSDSIKLGSLNPPPIS